MTSATSPANTSSARWQCESIMSGPASPAAHRPRNQPGSACHRRGCAASTMPFDSMPISFAGLRLATTTIVRPTSCLRLVRFGDAGHERPLLDADIDRHLHELLRLRRRAPPSSTLATRSSTFMKSSMAMRSSPMPAMARRAPGPPARQRCRRAGGDAPVPHRSGSSGVRQRGARGRQAADSLRHGNCLYSREQRLDGARGACRHAARRAPA